MTSLFPMFLKLEARQCLVIGAGKVAEPKIGGLLDTGARVRVVALAASSAVREWARVGKIELELRAFTPDDLEGHERVGLLSPDNSEIRPLVFRAAGRVPWSIQLRIVCWFSFNHSATSATVSNDSG